MIKRFFQRFFSVEDHEWSLVFYSFAYFFFLLSSYYILRPIRDEMGIQGGVRNLQWLFTGTFFAILICVPIYAWFVSKFPRKTFLPWVYHFFALNILIFWALLHFSPENPWVARCFFIWTSIFNLFVVSVFWSFMADIYKKNQASRLYGLIAAGGTLGAILGPIFTISLVKTIGPAHLLLLSVLLLQLAIRCIKKLIHHSDAHQEESPTTGVMGGHPFEGMQLVFKSWYLAGICAFIFLYTACSTFLYFAQAEIISEFISSSEDRTALFAMMDFLVNTFTLICQLFLTGRVLSHFGTALGLIALPVMMALGFFILSAAPLLLFIVIFQVGRRGLNYAITRPARESLFNTLSREEKYKAKNFIDTVVYRGGDAITGWVFAGLKGLGLALPALMMIAAPMAILWSIIGWTLGKKRDAIQA